MKKLLLSISLFSIGLAANAQWVEQATGFTTQFRGLDEIYVIDANTVWAKAYDGSGDDANVQEFARTTDGGTSWSWGYIDVGDPTLKIGNLIAVDADNAWVSAFDETLGAGGVLKTSNGGASWDVQNMDTFTGPTSWCDGVHFFNANVGISWGDPESATATHLEFYRTTDGGENWAPLAAFNSAAFTSGDYAYAGLYAYSGNSIWLPTATGKIYRSHDMGATWTRINSPINDFGHTNASVHSGRLYFSDANNGILIDVIFTNTSSTATVSSRKLYKTTDGGTTWGTGVTYTSPYNFNISYIPGTTNLVGNGVTGTGTSAVYSTGYSLDNGTNWVELDNGTQRTSIAFLDNTTGWAGGFNEDDITGGIFKFSGTLGNQQFASKSFKVYPNPATSTVNISAEQLDAYSVKVTDITGKVMMAKELNGMENTVDVSSYATGLYFFEIKSGSKSETIKIVKN